MSWLSKLRRLDDAISEPFFRAQLPAWATWIYAYPACFFGIPGVIGGPLQALAGASGASPPRKPTPPADYPSTTGRTSHSSTNMASPRTPSTTTSPHGPAGLASSALAPRTKRQTLTPFFNAALRTRGAGSSTSGYLGSEPRRASIPLAYPPFCRICGRVGPRRTKTTQSSIILTTWACQGLSKQSRPR